ncbi:MAG: transporter [Gammaproteobacteria bacterium]
MQKHNIAKSILCLSLLGEGGSSLAANLSDQINSLFGPSGIFLADQVFTPAAGGGAPIRHTAHFSSESLATLGLLVKQLAPNAAEFPSISTVPGFTYTFNPDIQTFERSSSMGPVYFERPQSLGAGKFDLGLAYAFVNFEELEGQDLDGLSFPGLAHNDCCPAVGNPAQPGFETDTADLFFDEFDLESQVLSFFATFGITDRWDANILVPVVFTSLDITARAVLNDVSGSATHFFPDATRTATRFIDDDKTGVGDLLLRTKYHLYQAPHLNVASALTLRVPTGDEDNFQGLGDFTVTPFFSLAHERGPFDLHIGAGVEINTDDLDRSRVRYAAGVTYQMLQRVALLLDVIGSSGVKTQELSVAVPTFLGASPNPVPGVTQVQTAELRTDLVDLAVGLKANVAESMVGFITFFVPLNDEGLRTEVIPAAGLEMSF